MLMITTKKMSLIATLMAMFLIFMGTVEQVVFCRQDGEAKRLSELGRLRDELRLSASQSKADVTVIMGERMITEAASQIVGLEIRMPNGNTLRITSIDVGLRPAAAIVRIGVQAKSTVPVNLLLSGRLGMGEIRDDVFQMPFQITDVSLTNSRLMSLFLKAFVGEWLSPGKWNQELPPLEIPLEIQQAMDLPASRFNVDGSAPAEVSTPAYQSQLRFAITSLFVLDKRIAMRLQMIENLMVAGAARNVVRTSSVISQDNDLATLENEVERLSGQYLCHGDLQVKLNRRVINRLLEQIAAAQTTDLHLILKPGRIRFEEIDALVKIVNFTDVEDGNGRADLTRLSIDHIWYGKLNLMLSMQGEVDARLRGREYGIPYRISPHTTFSIRDRIVPLELVSEGERVLLRASPGASLPIDLRFTVKVAGRDVGINRKVLVQADRWLSRIEIPSFFGTGLSLPRKLEVDPGGNLQVTRRQKVNFIMSKMRVKADEDAIDMIADTAFTQ